MSAEVVIDTPVRCDFHPDHGYAAVDGRSSQGTWGYFCPTCWRLYGCGLLGTGHGQRLTLREMPTGHLLELRRALDGEPTGRMGVVLIGEGPEQREWEQRCAFPSPPMDGVDVLPPIRVPEGLLFCWELGPGVD